MKFSVPGSMSSRFICRASISVLNNDKYKVVPCLGILEHWTEEKRTNYK